MPRKNWTLLDVPSQTVLDQLTVSPADVGGSATGYKVQKRTLRGGLSDGVDVVTLDNGTLKFDVLPTRGMGLWKAWAGGEEIGWRSPVRGPVHPQFVPVGEASGLGWLDGFDELLVRCGLESNGAPEFDAQGRVAFPLHGRIANKPAQAVSVSVDGDHGELSVTGVVEETRFHFLKLRMTSTVTTRVGESALEIRDEIENLSGSPAAFQMLYHVNFGLPLLDAGSRVVAPVKTVVPRTPHAAAHVKSWDSYAAEQAGFEEQVYFLALIGDGKGETETLLKNAHGLHGVSLRFPLQQLPHFTIWKNTTSHRDGYVTGLEPGTNFPNPRSHERKEGREVVLAPGAKTTLQLRMEFHRSAADVERAEKRIAAIQGKVAPTLFDAPQPGWCAGV